MGLLLFGIAVLPSLYAWFNLSASWDPYSNTSDIPIAVVNEDEGATIEGKEVNVGRELVNNLRENDDLGWTFVSREEADEGVLNGTYYASIYIGKDFSRDLLRVVDGEPTPVEIHYKVNEKINAIAPKMTSAGASSIVTKISEQFIREASKALFTELHEIGVKLEDELPTIRKLEKIIFDLEKKFPEINRLADIVIEIDANWETWQEKADRFFKLQELFPYIQESASQLLLIEEKLPEIKELANFAVQLEESLPAFESTFNEIDRIEERFKHVVSRLEQSLTRIETARLMLERAEETLPKIEETVQSVDAYVQALQVFFDQIERAAEPVIDVLIGNLAYVEYIANTVDTTLEEIEHSETVDRAVDIITVLHPHLKTGETMLQHSINLFTAINRFSPNGRLQPVIDRLAATKAKVEELRQGMEAIIDAQTVAKERIPSIRKKAQTLARSSAELSRFLNERGKHEIIDVIKRMNERTIDANEILVRMPEIEKMVNDAKAIVIIGEEGVNELLNSVPNVEAKLHDLISKLESDLPRIIASIQKVSRFVQEDVPEIEEKIERAADFIRNDLQQFEREYERLTELLEHYLPLIERAVRDLATFSRDTLPDIEAKVGNIADRLRQFENEHDLSDFIRLLKNDIEAESDFFANPVRLKEEKLFPIPNYGSANAPFYTALSLWVGALLISNLVSTNLHPLDMKDDYKAHHIYFGRLLLFLIVGILQAFIVSTGNFLLLDAYAAHPILYIVFTIWIGVVFMTIVYTFTSILGNFGKAIAVILMVLQLSGSGGTFPIQVAPPFFQLIHPYLPFTYAITLLREAVGGVILAIVWKQIIALSCFFVFFLIIGAVLKKPLAERVRKTMEKSKSSRLME